MYQPTPSEQASNSTDNDDDEFRDLSDEAMANFSGASTPPLLNAGSCPLPDRLPSEFLEDVQLNDLIDPHIEQLQVCCVVLSRPQLSSP
jgi:hypothetical protein